MIEIKWLLFLCPPGILWIQHHLIYLVVVRIELGTFECEAKSFNPSAIVLGVRVQDYWEFCYNLDFVVVFKNYDKITMVFWKLREKFGRSKVFPSTFKNHGHLEDKIFSRSITIGKTLPLERKVWFFYYHGEMKKTNYHAWQLKTTTPFF